MNDRCGQRNQILDLLLMAHGDWVPLPKIADCAAQYNARIFELRRQGFRIANRTKDVNGTRHSWFRLEPGPEKANSRVVHEVSAAIDRDDALEARRPAATLFGDLSPDRSYAE